MSKVQPDKQLEANLRALIGGCRTNGEARKDGGQPRWMRPADAGADPAAAATWNGDLRDWRELGAAFSRESINSQLSDLVKAEAPGTAGDVAGGSMQLELQSQMERAFRMRHCSTFPRTLASHAGRERGLGDDRGALGRGTLELVRQILKAAS